jgi:hypothetical protein
MNWQRSLLAGAVVGALLAAHAAPAKAAPLRSPQVALAGLHLQGYLDSLDPGVDVAHAQLDAQAWAVSVTGVSDFSLMLRDATGSDAIGIYNAGDASATPALFQVFPAAAGAGWYAVLHFVTGSVTVTLFDAGNTPQGQVEYSGVTQDDFGFYLQNSHGTLYSQDGRNACGVPQVLTYLSPSGTGDWWECFEDSAYVAGASHFDSVVLDLQSLRPTPARGRTWGGLKALYR